METRNLHSNLRFLRNCSRLSMPQVILEAKLDLPQNTFASYEDSRENKPRIEVLKKLLDFYNDKLATHITYDDIYSVNLEETGLAAFRETSYQVAEQPSNKNIETLNPIIDLEFLKMERLKKIEIEKERAIADKERATTEKLRLELEMRKIDNERIIAETESKRVAIELKKMEIEEMQLKALLEPR